MGDQVKSLHAKHSRHMAECSRRWPRSIPVGLACDVFPAAVRFHRSDPRDTFANEDLGRHDRDDRQFAIHPAATDDHNETGDHMVEKNGYVSRD